MLEKYPVNACGLRDDLSGDMFASSRRNFVPLVLTPPPPTKNCFLRPCLWYFTSRLVLMYYLYCGKWKCRRNQCKPLVKVLYCSPSSQPLEVGLGFKHQSQRWEASVLLLRHSGLLINFNKGLDSRIVQSNIVFMHFN